MNNEKIKKSVNNSISAWNELEKESNKKIIGYKIIKPEYKKAVKQIIKSNKNHKSEWWWVNFDENIEKGKGFNFASVSYDTENDSIESILHKSGVLNLWFEPVYEETISAKDFLLEILGNELTIKIDKEKYQNSVFYFKGESFLLELEKLDSITYLWCNYNEIWNPISTKYSLNYASIQDLIKETVEEHFKLSDVTPKSK